MVIGGYSNYDYSALTYYYDRNEGEWINGPSLMEGRYGHAAGIVTDEVTNEKFVVVTGDYFLNSTEMLQDGKWIQGIKMKDTIC